VRGGVSPSPRKIFDFLTWKRRILVDYNGIKIQTVFGKYSLFSIVGDSRIGLQPGD
jgi:hypothetical protein